MLRMADYSTYGNVPPYDKVFFKTGGEGNVNGCRRRGGRDRHCVQPDVVSSACPRAAVSAASLPSASCARLGRARSAASARRQVSICRRNRGAAWHWRQALQWRRRCDEGKSIGDAGAGRSRRAASLECRAYPKVNSRDKDSGQTSFKGGQKDRRRG